MTADKGWITVSVPVHPEGVGGNRGQGSIQATQVLRKNNLHGNRSSKLKNLVCETSLDLIVRIK